MSFSVGALPSWLAYNATTHVLSGTPPVDNAGSVDVSVTVTDGNGGSLAATVTFDPVNPAPDAVIDSTATAFATPVVVDLLANDTDADGDPLTVTSATVPAAQGTLSLSGTTWTFTPASGFSGTATITYTIQDQDGATDTATHTVVVGNAAPVLVDPDPTPGTPSIVDPTHLLVPATDNVAVSIDLDSYFNDPNGDPLSFSVGALPSWLAYNATTHVLSGTPPVDNAGSVDVSVTVTDGNGGSLAATVTFDPVNPAPDAVIDTTRPRSPRRSWSICSPTTPTPTAIR